MRNQKMFDVLKSAVEKAKVGAQSYNDDSASFWKLEGDKAGLGQAVIRFLPAKSDDDVPFVKLFSHGFQGPMGRWFIENCPTTIGKPCPTCEANGILWNSGVEADKEIVRKRKRKVGYISNVLIVSDPAHPEFEGKVFKFKFGQKIFDKLIERINPPFAEDSTDPEDQPLNPFDPFEGANFRLKMRRVEGYANFDTSKFMSPGPLGSEEEIKEAMAKVYDLNEIVAEGNFKKYDELHTKHNSVLAGQTAAKVIKNVEADDEDESYARKVTAAAQARPAPKTTKPVAEDDDSIDFFKRLAEETD